MHIIMACHNRKPLTVRAIGYAAEAAHRAGIDVDFVVFDDGSTDGTAAAVRAMDVPTQIIDGDGTAFWARGMAAAEEAALKLAEPGDWVLWLNDDVQLDNDALDRLLAVGREHPGDVVVGAMRHPERADIVTYGGLRRGGRHPLSYRLVEPADDVPVDVETCNGNCLLVPVETARRVGGIDRGFPHALADIDYGLRCHRAGRAVLLAPRTVGRCPRNPVVPRTSMREAWRSFISVKGGGHLPGMHRLLRKIRPRSWPVYVVWTYTLWWVRALVGTLLGRDPNADRVSQRP